MKLWEKLAHSQWAVRRRIPFDSFQNYLCHERVWKELCTDTDERCVYQRRLCLHVRVGRHLWKGIQAKWVCIDVARDGLALLEHRCHSQQRLLAFHFNTYTYRALVEFGETETHSRFRFPTKYNRETKVPSRRDRPLVTAADDTTRERSIGWYKVLHYLITVPAPYYNLHSFEGHVDYLQGQSDENTIFLASSWRRPATHAGAVVSNIYKQFKTTSPVTSSVIRSTVSKEDSLVPPRTGLRSKIDSLLHRHCSCENKIYTLTTP